MNPNDLAAQQAAAGGGAAAMVMSLIYLAVGILMIASMWKIFSKAGKPGWAAIIPIYNIIVMLEIVGKPMWWFILFCIPVVNFVIAIIVYIELAKVFGKSTGFGIGLLLLGVVFFPMLGFGSAQYQGASGSGGAPAAA